MTKNSPKPYNVTTSNVFLTQKGQNSQNKNFPRHNTAIRWIKAIVSSFWASYVKFWYAVLKKKLKTWFFGQKWPNFGPKKVKWPKNFYHNPNLLYLVLNRKLGLKNKNCQTNISRLEETGQKWSKTSICHHKQCIFDQKWAKTAKTRIFQTQHYR